MKTKIKVYFRITHIRKASNIGHELQFLSPNCIRNKNEELVRIVVSHNRFGQQKKDAP